MNTFPPTETDKPNQFIIGCTSHIQENQGTAMKYSTFSLTMQFHSETFCRASLAVLDLRVH